MIVLGIESSCDETGIAIYDSECGLRANVVYSQIPLHAEYGGVVPELASRDHIRKILPLIKQALNESNLTLLDINGIAYTKGPGLVGSLMVGASMAKSLAFSSEIACIGIHHMEAHLLAAMLEEPQPKFPFIALLVSGGHTSLVQVTDLGKYDLLGESVDDAVGEAFDKTAKLLGLSYPGGAALAKLAERGDNTKFKFPRPMLDRANLDFSFSGLKTCVATTVAKLELDEETKVNIASAFQEAVVDVLVEKSRRALKSTGLHSIVVAGGVGANVLLRARLQQMVRELSAKVFFPRQEFCTDNGAMIAFTGYQRLSRGERDKTWEIDVKPRWSLEDV